MKHKSLTLAMLCFAIMPSIWFGGILSVSAQEEPPPEIESMAMQTITMSVTVPGANVGAQGGFTSPRVTLLPGDIVTIDPVGGIVDFNTNGICTGNAYDASPGGKPRSEIYQGSCWDPDLNSCLINQNDPLPGQNHAGLFRPFQPGIGSIKWIGNNNDTFTYTGTTARDLRLGVNDVACPASPNGGAFNVQVTIKRPQVQTVNVVIRGSNTATSEVIAAPLAAGDQVVIDNISGTVDFLTDRQAVGCPFVVNANGLSRIPAQMTAGRPYTVSVTMRNTGGTTWQPGVWKLGAENPRDNGTWGVNRVQLDNPVAPNETATFEFVVTAPAAPGTYNFQRRMLQEGYQWFGAYTPNVVVTVR